MTTIKRKTLENQRRKLEHQRSNTGTEAATKNPQKVDPKNCTVLTSAMNHGSKLSRNNRVEKIIRRKRELSFYGTADLGKSILNGVGSSNNSDSDVDRKIKGSPPHSPEMPRGGIPGLARSSSLRLPRSRFGMY